MKTVLLTLLFLVTLCEKLQINKLGLAQENWNPIVRTISVNGNKGYGGVNYPNLFTFQIRGSVSCSSICDIYLLSQTEFDQVNN
jgi:hypothetical protein